MSRKFNKFHNLAGVLLTAALSLSASAACAGNVGVDLNLHIGNSPQQVVVREPAAALPARIVTIEEDVDFIYPEALGFYVAVGVPYDLFYMRNRYYLFRDGRWFSASRNHGPWVVVERRDLPPGLRRHKLERIRACRDEEHDIYHRDREHYRGRHFRAGKDEWKAQRKEEKEYWKEVKRMEKEERKHHRGGKHDD